MPKETYRRRCEDRQAYRWIYRLTNRHTDKEANRQINWLAYIDRGRDI